MPQYNTIEGLLQGIKKQVNNSLIIDVAEVVVINLMEHVQKDVYEAYPNPRRYIRSYEKGEKGLGSKESFIIKKIPDGINIINNTEHNGKYIPNVVEFGKGYDYTGYGYEYEQPRPYNENTYIELLQTNEHIKALKLSLRKKGINAE